MALAKDRHQTSSTRSFYENMLEVESLVEFPHISPYEFDDYDHQQQQKHDEVSFESPNSHNKLMISTNQVMISNSPAISTSSSANSSNNGLNIHHQASNYHLHPQEEANSLINFKSEYRSFMDSNQGSLLNFQNEDQLPPENYNKSSHPINHHYPIWEGSSSISSIDHHHQQSQLKEMNNCTSNKHLLEEVNHLRTSISDYNQDSSANDWVYAEESATKQTSFNKRPYMEKEKAQASKKQCRASASKKPAKLKSISTLKDPQSVAAKNRRERISERLKILQDLVPNGSKVDMVTMLEKAIGYVKFLQLQVKVLATDEFWPAAGGKAPDISQVKEAIDAILSSQRSSEGTTSLAQRNGQALESEAK
ncbi:uncharacterized protein LOC141630854 [Silene latifolia]|uniref:uncharacterized protein LOC141630854 n=1 Tax=Silene latifolia TaxID=37657 RepID=UPI003D7850D4